MNPDEEDKYTAFRMIYPECSKQRTKNDLIEVSEVIEIRIYREWCLPFSPPRSVE